MVSDDRVVAFKASGGRSESSREYQLKIRPQIVGTWDRQGVRMVDLADGERSKGGTLMIGGELVPVARPNLNGEPNTGEPLAVLAG